MSTKSTLVRNNAHPKGADFAERLRGLIKKAGYKTPNAWAVEAGVVSRRTVANWLANPEAERDALRVARVAEHFGVPFEWLEHGTGALTDERLAGEDRATYEVPPSRMESRVRSEVAEMVLSMIRETGVAMDTEARVLMIDIISNIILERIDETLTPKDLADLRRFFTLLIRWSKRK